MKRRFTFVLAMLMALTLTACAQVEPAPETVDVEQAEETTSQAEAQPSQAAMQTPEVSTDFNSPLDLLSEPYNPFYQVEFPEGYTVYMAAYERSEYNLYRLYLTAEDSAENAVTFISELLGDDASESIQLNIDMLKNENWCSIPGTQVDKGLNADAEISKTEQNDGDYAYVEGYKICLVMGIDAARAAEYENILMLNYNLNPLSMVANYFDLVPVPQCELKVNTQKNKTQLTAAYQMEQYSELKQSILNEVQADIADENGMQLSYGNIAVSMHFNDAQSVIYVDECLTDTSLNLRDYSPSQTLQSLGFENWTEEDAKCTYKSEADGVYLSVNREEWGSPQSGEEKNAVMMIQRSNDDELLVCYFRTEGKYFVQMGNDQITVKYTWLEGEDKYINEWGEDDLSAAKQTLEQLLNKPDTDSILGDPITTFDQYIRKTFGVSPDALYEMPLE